VSDLGALIDAQGAVVGTARKGPLPDELRDLPAQATARLKALVALEGRDPLQSGGAEIVRKRETLDGALRRAIGAAYAAVQKIDDEKVLPVVAQVMAGNGQSLALLRLSMNRPPVPDAFETGKAP
jgi:hypothetical protein